MQQQRDGPGWEGPFHDWRRNVNAAVWCAQVWSRPVEAWLRRPGTPGERYFDGQAALGLLWAWGFGTLAAGQGPGAEGLGWLYGFVPATCLVLLGHRVGRARLRRLGWDCHSRYSGTPWLGGADEVRVKLNKEPALVLAAALVAAGASAPLGLYLLGAFVSLLVANEYQRQADLARVRDLKDARYDQQWLARQLRRPDDE